MNSLKRAPAVKDDKDDRPSVVSLEVHRPCAQGKFIFAGGEKLYIRGVTYGAFRPRADGAEYPEPAVVERDFAQMAANGINAIRAYTVPPRWLLDAASRHGLRVLVGLSMELYVGFLADQRDTPDIERLVRDKVRGCAGHAAVLCYAVGNEIPTQMVRWHGPARIERYIKRLYDIVKTEDPRGLLTYVNYPSTEYLQLPFLDLVCFNVYLETQDRLDAYLARLQNIAGDRPLIMAEIGLDSRRNGEAAQAQILDWQLRTTFAAGCAGAFIFSWTDEWYTAGRDVEDWDFGLTRRDRYPKPALAAVRKAYAQAPFPASLPWPRISVVVCSYNGARTIRDCLAALSELQYPNFEVIVVNDGSTDATASIATEYDVRLINTENRGLSSARNTGLAAATGEIVAYVDDDAYPDPHWLTYLGATFLSTTYAAAGGPNIAPPGDGWLADCVANAPGGPTHVLLSDREAEHVPGCNMAFRKRALQAIGGFDPRFRVAGDDVDVCWRLTERGWTVGFSPAAMVWHHRRGSLRAYWRQQFGYAKAEALLERKWPEKYSAVGHATWMGRLYGAGLTQAFTWRRVRIYQGRLGSAPFQSLYQPAPALILSLPLMPEWYLIIAVLTGLCALGLLWPLLLLVLPLLGLAMIASLVQAGLSATRASFASAPRTRAARFKFWSTTAFLHLLQPLARLCGRLRHGLTPWRRRGLASLATPRRRIFAIWSECWRSPAEWLQGLEAVIKTSGTAMRHGGDYDRWDLEVRGGMLGAVRVLMGVEEHGAGKQLVRLRTWPRLSPSGLVLVALFIIAALMATIDEAWPPAALLGACGAGLLARALWEGAIVTGTVLRAIDSLKTAGSSSGGRTAL